MLSLLSIRNIATIEELTLEFEKGETALSGETGSGKSLIVTSLLLLTGERADFSLVRDKSKKAVVSAVFDFDDSFLNSHEEVKEVAMDNSIIVKRVLNPDKSNRIYLNDELVTLSKLKEVMQHVLNIHSQNTNLEILSEEKQLSYIDLFNKEKIFPLKEEFKIKYQDYLSKKEELEKLISSNKEIDSDYLSFQIKEIEKFHLKENEIEDLNEEYQSLRGFEKLKENYERYSLALEGNSLSLNDFLSDIYSKLRSFTSTPLEEKAQDLKEKINLLEESLFDFDDCYQNLKIDPERIDSINARLFSLKDLQRKFGKTTKEILDKYQSFKEKLSLSENFKEEMERQKKEIEKAYDDALCVAKELSSLRKESSILLEKKISEEMSLLGLRKNGLEIQIKEVPLHGDGIDKACFLVSMNEGLEKNTLAKALSGGEASRLTLAIKIALNCLNPYSTLVLDEIDSGISGKSASVVSKKLISLSKDSQLLLVSHLPQVVAGSSTVIEIKKEVKENVTYTKGKTLSKEEFLHLIARMISGDKESDTAYKQANSLYLEYHA